MNPTTRDYCQFLISTQINYTQTYFSEHHKHFSHDAVNRYLHDANVTPDTVWELIKNEIDYDPGGYIIFDDSVLDKTHSTKIELVKKQYSGNVHGIIKGIGVVNCLYVNSKTKQCWVIDWRIYAPDDDQKSKLKHAQEMFDRAMTRIAFSTVLMDSWYATKELMLHIHRSGKTFYCPMKKNRNVDDSGGESEYKAISELTWTDEEQIHGKLVKIKGLPGAMKVKLFRVVIPNYHTEWVATNDIKQSSTNETEDICSIRWKIEQYHREVKQVLGIEKCQCRSGRSQRNHIGCVILAWHQLTALARKLGKNIYDIKNKMLSSYMRQELNNPSVPMIFV